MGLPAIRNRPAVLGARLQYSFKPGQSGKLILEFYITPFDYAGCEGPWRALETQLTENKLIGMGLGLIDWEDVNAKVRDGFWNISHQQFWYGNASMLVGFQLMPLEPQYQKNVEKKLPVVNEGFPAGDAPPGGRRPPAK